MSVRSLKRKVPVLYAVCIFWGGYHDPGGVTHSYMGILGLDLNAETSWPE